MIVLSRQNMTLNFEDSEQIETYVPGSEQRAFKKFVFTATLNSDLYRVWRSRSHNSNVCPCVPGRTLLRDKPWVVRIQAALNLQMYQNFYIFLFLLES